MAESIHSITVPTNNLPAHDFQWRVSLGTNVLRDDLLGTYEYFVIADSQLKKMKCEVRSPIAGSVEYLISPSTKLSPDSSSEPIATIKEPCSHPVQIRGMCGICGADLQFGHYLGSETSRATFSITHTQEVKVSDEIAQKLDKENTQRLIKDKKLSLILDLDQTLIHAHDKFLDLHKPTGVHYFSLTESPHKRYYIKLRPGTKELISQITSLYELHIYTAGSRNYARKIAEIIDPDKSIFKERILSRDDTGDPNVKSLTRLFPCDQSMVVVVDDNVNVWKNWTDNLIRVQPCALFKILEFEIRLTYFVDTFFIGAGDINNTAQMASRRGKSGADSLVHAIDPTTLLPVDISSLTIEAKDSDTAAERIEPLDNDGELYAVHNILKDIHRTFYDQYEQRYTQVDNDNPDVRRIIPSLIPQLNIYHQAKKQVLADCHILFSNVIALNTDPKSNYYWMLAEQFGATCHTEVTGFITHVVAHQTGTKKVLAAKEEVPGVFIVFIDWLKHSVARWHRMDEHEYLLEPHIPMTEAERIKKQQDLEKYQREQSQSQSADYSSPFLTEEEEDIDPSDLAIINGTWERPPIEGDFETTDWDKEVDEALGDEESSEGFGFSQNYDEDEEGFDPEEEGFDPENEDYGDEDNEGNEEGENEEKDEWDDVDFDEAFNEVDGLELPQEPMRNLPRHISFTTHSSESDTEESGSELPKALAARLGPKVEFSSRKRKIREYDDGAEEEPITKNGRTEASDVYEEVNMNENDEYEEEGDYGEEWDEGEGEAYKEEETGDIGVDIVGGPIGNVRIMIEDGEESDSDSSESASTATS
ncbi:Carboxy-terminal domain (CTD) phosphatase [Nowakowskiella sp. JEL0407]|nr:Carboxy-terminal domain (CTD) phosphatase [Nowakowskiella sp. JEL0407]